MMTPRERWLAVLNGDPPDRIPMDYWSTTEATALLQQHLGVATDREMLERLHIDRPITVGPDYIGPEPATGEDIFGCRHRLVDYGTGAYSECVHHPLAAYGSVDENAALARRLPERLQSLLPRRSAAHAKELVMVEIVTFTFVVEAALLSVLSSIIIWALVKYEWSNRE